MAKKDNNLVSTRFGNAALYNGSFSEIVDPVADDALDARWVVIPGTTGLRETLPSFGYPEFYANIGMVELAAEGAFDEWTLDAHYPKHIVSAPDALGKQIDESNGTLKLAKDGKWYVDNGRKLPELAPDEQQKYHTLVNKLLSGNTITFSLPIKRNDNEPFLPGPYIAKIMENIHAGKGNVLAAKKATFKESKLASDKREVQKPYIDNDKGEEVGYEKKAPSLVVALVGGGTLDLLGKDADGKALVADGSKFEVYIGGRKEWGDQEWDSTDEFLVDFWQGIARKRSTTAVARQ